MNRYGWEINIENLAASVAEKYGDEAAISAFQRFGATGFGDLNSAYYNEVFGDLIVAHVHDEVIIEADKRMSLEAVCKQMAETPYWAEDLVLRADGYVCDFYKKD